MSALHTLFINTSGMHIISEINPLIKINDLSIASSKSDSLDLELRNNGIENARKKYPQNLTIIISIVK
jgi:hypothetical protein